MLGSLPSLPSSFPSFHHPFPQQRRFGFLCITALREKRGDVLKAHSWKILNMLLRYIYIYIYLKQCLNNQRVASKKKGFALEARTQWMQNNRRITIREYLRRIFNINIANIVFFCSIQFVQLESSDKNGFCGFYCQLLSFVAPQSLVRYIWISAFFHLQLSVKQWALCLQRFQWTSCHC